MYIGKALTAGSNPANKVHLFATSESWQTSSSSPQYPVQNGMPMTNFTAITSKTLTLTGYFFADENHWNDYEAQKKVNIIADWQGRGLLLTWWGRKGSDRLMIQDQTAVYDNTGRNVIGITLTLLRVQIAGNAKRIITRDAGKKRATPGGRSGGVYVTIKRGNTYWEFSKRYGTSIAQLRAWNHYRDRFLPIGKRVRVK